MCATMPAEASAETVPAPFHLSAPPARTPLQSGVHVFVFTDLANSTHLTYSLPPDVWRPARDGFFALQARLAREHGLVWLSPRGDGKFLVFARAADAARFAAALLRAVAEAGWGGVPVAVRVGIASGHADFLPTEEGGVQDDFVGAPLNLAARVCGVARPGEALLAAGVCAEARAGDSGLDFADLGEVDLKGLPPERVFRLVAPGLPQDFPPLAQRSNLDQFRPYSGYFGREQVVGEALGVLCGRQPVLTLLGDPGQGKTRLALEVGQQALDQFLDGVWFVPLEHVRQGGLVAEAVATALGLTAQSGRDIGTVLREHLRSRKTLLILDNCEQLLADPDADPGLLDFVEETVRACPQVRVLATSRVPLELGAGLERMLRLPDLPVPPPEVSFDADALRRFPSAALLCDRLTVASGGRFALDVNSAPYVASICQSLDGVPLYLELAAGQLARARTLPQIADDVYAMLQTRDRGYADRQRTLDRLLDFSCDILQAERDFFYQLGVFAGSFRAEDAAAVCDEPDAEARLQTLVLHSLVKSDAGENFTAAAPRYRLLQAPAAFGRRRLGDALPGWQRRHADYFLRYAQERDALLKGRRQKQAADEMAEALPNLRAAMDWALGAGENGLAAEYGAALGRFLYTRNLIREGRERIAAAREAARRAGDTSSAACCQSWATTFLRQIGATAAARTSEAEALALWRSVGDRSGEAYSLNALGTVTESPEEASALYVEALTLLSGRDDLWGEAQCLSHLGDLEMNRGQSELARHYHEQALALRERIGDLRGISNSLAALGRLSGRRSEYEAARGYYERAQALKRELDDRDGEAWCLYALGATVLRTGDPAAARDLYTQALAIFRGLGSQRLEGLCLTELATLAMQARNVAAARAHAQEALERCRSVGYRVGESNALLLLAEAASEGGDWDSAAGLAAEALEINRATGNTLAVAGALNLLGDVARRAGDLAKARHCGGEALSLVSQQGARFETAVVLDSLGQTAQRQGDLPPALLFTGAACAIFADLNLPPEQDSHAQALAHRDEALAALGQAGAEEGRTRAEAPSAQEAVQQALTWARSRPPEAALP